MIFIFQDQPGFMMEAVAVNMLKREAIIIFVRNPEIGKVKTRLGKETGDDVALHVYINLLKHTQGVTQGLLVDKYVYYTDGIIENDLWTLEGYKKMCQSGAELGHRMKNAFQELYNMGHDKVIIIGSDCPELNTVIIDTAFTQLDKYDMVLGPSKDG